MRLRVAYSYIRFSQNRQAFGDSTRRQLTNSKAYCERNGLVLDESLNLKDLGVSGFRGNNVRNGALAGFLEALRQGRIAKGSTLIIESVDRLSRDQVADALTLFLEILRHGVEIATLTPERLYTADSVNDLAGLLEPLIYMSRAFEESATKSTRIKEAWSQKRKDVRSGVRKSIGKQEPFWIAKTDDGFQLIPDQVKILNQMYVWMIDGSGFAMVARKLNDLGIRTPRLGRAWTTSSVVSVVNSRACLGEYHPSVMVDGVQVQEGSAIPDYYPRAVSDDVFYRAHHAVSLRKQNGQGRRAKETRNIFSGLLFNGLDSQPLYYFVARTPAKQATWMCRKLASKSLVVRNGESDKSVLYYDQFESAFLAYLIEVNPRDFIKGSNDSTNRIAEVSGKLVELDLRIQTVNKKLKSVEASQMEPLLNLLMEFTAERDHLRADLESLRAAESNHATDTVGMVQSLAGLLAEASESEAEELRTKLRQHLKNLIQKIRVYPEATGRGKRNKALYNLTVWIDFHDGLIRWFKTNQDGDLILNIKMPSWLKAAWDEAKRTGYNCPEDSEED